MKDIEQTEQCLLKRRTCFEKSYKRSSHSRHSNVTASALTDLLKHKPIQSISIKELCNTAGINRGTFYTHYTDIYDLLNHIEEQMLSDFLQAIEPLLSTDEDALSPVEITTGVFQCLKENSDICTVTLGNYGDKAFAMKLFRLGREKCMQAYSKHFRNATPKQIDYYYAFVSAGCMGLLQKWLEEGMVTSAQTVAKMAESIMIYGMGFLEHPETD